MEFPPDVQKQLGSAVPGQIVDAGTYPLDDVPPLTYEKKAGGPPMVFSDDPEYFRVPEGAGVRERVEPGVVRLYVYHVNQTTDGPKRISAVIENLGSAPLTLRFHRYAFAGPNVDGYKVGKSALIQYLSGGAVPDPITVPAGGAAPIDTQMDRAVVGYDQLVHCFHDFEIDQPARITTLQTTLDTPAVVANARIREPLPAHTAMGAGRGLYRTSTFDVTLPEDAHYDTALGPRQIVVADGKIDPWLEGWDSSTGTSSRLDGNYGVVYRMRLPWRCSDGRALAVGLWYPPAGRKWCEACALAVKVNDGVHAGGEIPIPRDAVTFRGRSSVGVVQVYRLAKGSAGTVEIIYSPPGGSCLPVQFLLIPVSEAP